jgi:hypothetical protein
MVKFIFQKKTKKKEVKRICFNGSGEAADVKVF